MAIDIRRRPVPKTKLRGVVQKINLDRRNSLYDPAYELQKSFAQLSGAIDTGEKFPDRNGPLTIAVDIAVSGASPNGIIVELGSETSGIALWYDTATSKIGFAACDGADTLGFSGLSDSTYDTLGQRLRIVASVLPGSGEGRLWINGHLELSANFAESPTGAIDWADDSGGAIGDVAGTANARVPVGSAVALADVDIQGTVDFYKDQLPKHFVAYYLLGYGLLQSADLFFLESSDGFLLAAK